MHSRFFAPALEPGASLVTLPPDEANHLARVMRVRVGETVRVFNGRGCEYEGIVEAAAKGAVQVRLTNAVTAAAESATSLTLVQAILKGDAMDGVVRDAVMLGVSAIVPLLTARIETDRRASVAASRVPRWERVAVSSAKQCGRAVVPPILTPVTLGEALASVPAPVRLALVEPTTEWPPEPLERIRGAGAPPSAAIFVGPEGGWTPEEMAQMRAAGVQPVTLGARTLRAESAAIVGLTALHCTWGEFA